MDRFKLNSTSTLMLVCGDITQIKVDAIVNAANERMLGGGGVDGAIHHWAGPELLDACRAVPEVRPGVRCPRGEARLTPAFQLPSKYVIHTVGPIYHSPAQSAPVLASAYHATLDLANQHGVKSIAFPAISCGIYGYPNQEAAPIAIETCSQYSGQIQEIEFVLYEHDVFELWLQAAEESPFLKRQ